MRGRETRGAAREHRRGEPGNQADRPGTQTSVKSCTYKDMWSLSDESLLAGLGAGDPEAAAAFVRRFQGRVFGLAYTILGDRAGAEDASQETFVRAWRHAGAFDARRGGVSTWLLTIARNVAVDMVRLRRYEPADPETVLAMQLRSSDEDADEALMAAGEVHRLKHALARLPEDQQRALVLAAILGLTGREISHLEKVPLGTVKTRIRAAMLKLRSALEVSDE
jgi:RNA polymerase sigma factor (sigma-70 family)